MHVIKDFPLEAINAKGLTSINEIGEVGFAFQLFNKLENEFSSV